ncbi:MAG: 23S rRNA (adenine(2503)-C(2))-methyltransferase RlmN [Planctomycetes bacterium]|nr:23S rRNA (adenine(2503)-C(2))-methyltransferase RlmN [Planctomycetota bacterium]
MTPLPAITAFTAQEFEERLQPLALERFRARQILQWIYRRRASSFETMTDLSLEHRTLLAQSFRPSCTSVAQRHACADLTEKLLLRLDDGNLIETVLIRDGDRKTVCVSTQVGCPIRCVFCASGLDGRARDLTTAEIVEQVLTIQNALPEGDRVDNLVLMGIGEPLLNYANVTRALRIFKASWGLGIGYNRITLSTIGILDRIPQLVEDRVTPNLAISLHAPNDRIRREIVPTMKKKVAELIRAAVEYKRATKKNVTLEIVLLDGVNDDKKHALELGKKLRGTRVKVNVIPFNRVAEVPYREPSPERVTRFVKTLGSCGVPVTVRKRKGDAISAACGQLRHQARPRDTAVAIQGEPIPIPPSALDPSAETPQA